MKRTRALPLLALATLASLTAATAPDTYDPQNPVAPSCTGSPPTAAGPFAGGGITPLIAVDGAVYEPPAGAKYAGGWPTGRPWRYLGTYPDEVQVLVDWGDFSQLQDVRQAVEPPMGICSWHKYSAPGTYTQRTLVMKNGTEIGAIEVVSPTVRAESNGGGR